jgi:hypothetical protein
MSTVQAIIFGMMLALTPSLLLAVILICKSRSLEDEQRPELSHPSHAMLPAQQPGSNSNVVPLFATQGLGRDIGLEPAMPLSASRSPVRGTVAIAQSTSYLQQAEAVRDLETSAS